MIAIGCDHGGFALKQEVMHHLDELGLAYKDFGTYSEESCDYPIYGEAVARAVAGGECARGNLISRTGNPNTNTRNTQLAGGPPARRTALLTHMETRG